MRKTALILAMVICGLFCFAHLGFCAWAEVGVVLIGYDANNSTLVGITSAKPNYQFVRINFSTGLLTSLNSNVGDDLLMAFTSVWMYGGSCVSGNTFYAIRWKKPNDCSWASDCAFCYIVSIDMGTGQLTESPALHF